MQAFGVLPAEPIDIISSREGAAARSIALKFQTFPRKSAAGYDELFGTLLITGYHLKEVKGVRHLIMRKSNSRKSEVPHDKWCAEHVACFLLPFISHTLSIT